MKKIYLYGNWKMNMNRAETEVFFSGLAKETAPFKDIWGSGLEVALFPPFTSIERAHELAGLQPLSPFIGAQNGYFEKSGAFTGEISLSMLAESGVSRILIGHSERRHIFGESDELIAKKVKAALDANITPVLCYGETLEERESGKTFEVMERQLRTAIEPLAPSDVARIIYAYEPVWAIGTGKSATSQEAQEVCEWSKKLIGKMTKGRSQLVVLYGGSVKAANAKELLDMEAIDGALVGGASLKPEAFMDIYRAWISH